MFSKVCGDYLLSRMDVTSCISYRNFASCMGDSRLLNKVDAYIQEHLLQISEEEEFLKLPRLKVRSKISKGILLSSRQGIFVDISNK